jgi:hypothetical protein
MLSLKILATTYTLYILVPTIEADDFFEHFRQPLNPSLRLFLGHHVPNS